MNWTEITLIALVIYALTALVIGPILDRKRKTETDTALQEYRDYCRLRDIECPDMVGKWGKP